jgi:hypothetical protein
MRASRVGLVTLDGYYPPYPNQCHENMTQAFYTRILTGTEIIADPEGKEDRQYFIRREKAWKRAFPFEPPEPLKVPSTEAWLESMLRSEDKERVRTFRDAIREVETTTWNSLREKQDPFTKGRIPEMIIDPFIKAESYPGKGDWVKTRNISDVNETYAVAHGPAAKGLTEKLKSLWDGSAGVLYTSGYDPSELGSLVKFNHEKFAGGLILENDYSSFEATVSTAALALEFYVYRKFMGLSKKEERVFRKQFHQRIFSKYGHKASRKGGRASGVGNTSCGNTVINVCLTLIAMEHCLDEKKPLGEQIFLLALGDDSLLFMSPEVSKKFRQHQFLYEVSTAGFNAGVKIHQSHDLEMAEYCSGWFGYDDKNDVHWFPKAGRVLTKTFFIHRKHNDWKPILKGMCVGLENGALDPVLAAATSSLVERCGDVEADMREQAYKTEMITGKKKSVIRASKYSLYVRYGLSCAQIDALTSYVKDACTTQWPVQLNSNVCPALSVLQQVDVDMDVTPGKSNVRFDFAGANVTHLQGYFHSLAGTQFDQTPEEYKYEGKKQRDVTPMVHYILPGANKEDRVAHIKKNYYSELEDSLWGETMD